ncbi:hypothetical protein ACHAXT_007172 [Thalassiosira profunda]
MSRGRSNPGLIARIFNDITWDAGLVVRRAFRGLHKPRKTKKKPTEFVRFVYKGNWYRRPIQKQKKKPPELIKLPPAGPQVVPQPFKTPPPQAAAEVLAATKPAGGGGGAGQQSTWSWRSWWKLNAPLVLLNVGSLATLVGFTRADVLELRSLALTGNCTFIMYSLMSPPVRWGPIGWVSLFAGVNGYNIVRIMTERKGKVFLSEHEEEIFNEHFQPFGVTPKQFEKVMSQGKMRIIPKGGVLSRQGEQMSSVKLVVRGKTRANVMGRHLTAMGSMPGNRLSMQGGDSGAWVGEMAFLQSLWDRDHAPKSLGKKLSGKNDKEAEASPATIRSGLPPSDEPYKYCAISTIVAVEDIEVIEWSFEDMEKVMKSSLDMQGSLTRAMTAAMMGKVVNFMVSRQSVVPKWTTMLDNWRYNSPRHRKDEQELCEEDAESEEEEGRSFVKQPLATSAAWLLRHSA